MYNNRSQGFTLIELLVVIAIIGILSAVVLASLNTARSKGADAAIQSDLSTIQTQAEIYYGNNNNYGPALATTTGATGYSGCTTGIFSDPTIANAVTGAYNAAGAAGTNISCAIGANGAFYSIAVTLKTNSSASWCVSNSGVAKQVNVAAATALNAGNGCI